MLNVIHKLRDKIYEYCWSQSLGEYVGNLLLGGYVLQLNDLVRHCTLNPQ